MMATYCFCWVRGSWMKTQGTRAGSGGCQLREVSRRAQRHPEATDAGLKVALPQEERPKKEEGGGSRRKVRVGGNSTHCRVHPSSRSFPLRRGHHF